LKLLERAANGAAVTAHQIEFAEDGLRRWEAIHGPVNSPDYADEPIELPARVPSPHIYGDREPGSDDDEVAA
jgi:hypothetical protein